MNRYKTHHQMSETFILGALLAVAGGFLDAYTYIARGKVFANAQTGNIVLLGLNLAHGEFGKALNYVVPIAAFILGVFVVEMVRTRCAETDNSSIHWRQIVVLIELAVVSAVALIPSGDGNMAANVAISFVCSMQVQSFRKLRGDAYATTMCTGNLRSGTELLYHKIRNHDTNAGIRSLRYYGIIGFFVIGVILGAWMTGMWGESAILFCSLILVAAFLIMFIKET